VLVVCIMCPFLSGYSQVHIINVIKSESARVGWKKNYQTKHFPKQSKHKQTHKNGSDLHIITVRHFLYARHCHSLTAIYKH